MFKLVKILAHAIFQFMTAAETPTAITRITALIQTIARKLVPQYPRRHLRTASQAPHLESRVLWRSLASGEIGDYFIGPGPGSWTAACVNESEDP